MSTISDRREGRIFLSHTSTDKTFVRRLAGDLRSHNVRVWLDEWEMKVGDSLVERIQRGIADSAFLAIVLTPQSVMSAWVRRELNAALAAELEQQRIFILPILAEDCEIPLLLRDKLYADFRTDYMAGLRALLTTVLLEPRELPPNCLFDSARDDPEFASWAIHFSESAYVPTIRLVADTNGSYVSMEASAQQTVGINKSVATLHGRVEF